MLSTIVCVVFNPYEVVYKSINSLMKKRSDYSDIIFVDNHSPDKRTRDFIHSFGWRNSVKIVDATKNIGSIAGYNLGFKHAEGKVVFKFDDDVIVDLLEFDLIISQYLLANPNVACCSGNIDIDPVPHHENQLEEYENSYFRQDNEINFSLIGWTREKFNALGELKSLTHNGRLYGDIEHSHRKITKEKGWKQMCCLSAPCIHIGAEDRLVFSLWKYYYGYSKKTDMPYEEFVENGVEQKKAFSEWVQKFDNGELKNWVGTLGISTKELLRKKIYEG